MKLYKATTYHLGSRQWNYHEATPEDIVAAFRKLPLTRQMRAASDGVVEADARLTPDLDHDLQPWDAKGIRAVAARFDREDEIGEMAAYLYVSTNTNRSLEDWKWEAEALLDAGYRKQATDE